MISDLLDVAFDKVDVFYEQLEPFLHAFWENKQCGDFSIVRDENLRNPTEVIPLLLARFN